MYLPPRVRATEIVQAHATETRVSSNDVHEPDRSDNRSTPRKQELQTLDLRTRIRLAWPLTPPQQGL
jgi:hypothetical protein